MRYLILPLLLLISWTTTSRADDPRMNLLFYLGPSITQTGNIQDLGDPNFNTAFEFNYFFKNRHGLGVSWGNEWDFEGSSKIPGLRDASIHTWDIHYTYRYHLQNSKLMFTFSPGVGIQTLYDESADYYWGYFYYDDLSSAWVIDYKFMVDYIAREWNTDGRDYSFFFGAGVQQIFSMNDDLYGRDISGSRLSLLFRVGVGF